MLGVIVVAMLLGLMQWIGKEGLVNAPMKTSAVTTLARNLFAVFGSARVDRRLWQVNDKSGIRTTMPGWKPKVKPCKRKLTNW